MKHNQVRQVVFPVITAMIWGSSFVAQSTSTEHVGAYTFNAARSFVGFLALLVVIQIFDAVNRRKQASASPSQEQSAPAENRKALVIGGICLDDNAKTVTVDGDPVALTPKEYDILRFLMRNAGTVFSPNEIYRRVWEDVPLNAAGAIAVHIRHLREKLEINPSEPRYIKVVWGKGYKMEGGVS